MAIVHPNDLSAIVDPGGYGEGGSRDIDCGEAAADVEETMLGLVRKAIGVRPYDLAAMVDPGGEGTEEGTGNIDCGEPAANVEEIMGSGGGGVAPYDLAIPEGRVVPAVAPGTSIVVKLPPMSRKPWDARVELV
jgi:hypothetical protein